jgi:hypothetical protein
VARWIPKRNLANLPHSSDYWDNGLVESMHFNVMGPGVQYEVLVGQSQCKVAPPRFPDAKPRYAGDSTSLLPQFGLSKKCLKIDPPHDQSKRILGVDYRQSRSRCDCQCVPLIPIEWYR